MVLHATRILGQFPRTWMDFKMADTFERRVFCNTILLKYHDKFSFKFFNTCLMKFYVFFIYLSYCSLFITEYHDYQLILNPINFKTFDLNFFSVFKFIKLIFFQQYAFSKVIGFDLFMFSYYLCPYFQSVHQYNSLLLQSYIFRSHIHANVLL